LTPTFDPTTFLSTLHNRFQTLEDLRNELRNLSQDLKKELLDLVNDNYQDFLGLGSSLKGGDEKVEEIRLGLLGFRREAEGLKAKVGERKREAEKLVDQRRSIREQMQIGRGLLEVDRNLTKLEERLMLVSSRRKAEADSTDMSESDDDSDMDTEEGISTSKLGRHAEQYICIERMIEKIGPGHPFLIKQQERIQRLRQTVLLDLNNAMKQVKLTNATSETFQPKLLRILATYRLLGESKDAVTIIKEIERSKP